MIGPRKVTLGSLLFLVAFLPIGCGVQTPTRPGEEDPNHLLSDVEILTAEDPNAPLENESWTAWIKSNHSPVRSLTSNNYADLQFLKALLREKRIVLLGESGHGVSEFGQAKVRLIKFLHTELDFEVVAFESSIFECFYANQNRWSPQKIMRNAILDVWHTAGILPLFEYIVEAKASDHPLILAGVDIQITSHEGALNRPQFFSEVLSKLDSNYASRIFNLDSTLVAKLKSPATGFDFIDRNRSMLVAAYDSLAAFLSESKEDLLGAYSEQPNIPLIALQTARSIGALIRQNISRSITERIRIRDRGMAENLTFLLQEVYKNKKIIVWAHNFHIRHDNLSISPDPVETMGKWISEGYSPELYTIGLYMYRGQAANNDREIYDIAMAKSGSLASIAYHARKKYVFIELLNQTPIDGNEWMFRAITAKAWGINEKQMILKNQYDGLLFIDTVSPPTYIF